MTNLGLDRKGGYVRDCIVALRTTTRRGCSFVANSFETSAQGTQRDDGVVVAAQTQVASGLASEATGL